MTSGLPLPATGSLSSIPVARTSLDNAVAAFIQGVASASIHR